MEKTDDSTMTTYTIILKRIIKAQLIIGLLFLFIFSMPQHANSQVRAGSGYLKMLHGAREVGVLGTLSGALDHTYSFYANPAATGLLREWQWSATYTNWISDIYDASFIYGRNIRMPWSRWTRFVIGINYLGIPDFNNANEPAPSVSGNNLLLTGSVGQPITMITRNLSVGANMKYFNSKLAGYKADVFIFDAGILYRTPRFTFLKPMDYIIFSAGLAITNMGPPITFISEETPLPRTFRSGFAVNMGTHHGFQMSVATDYRIIRDEDGFLTLGAELSWRQLISLRMGYSWEDNLLGHFTFGGGLRLDDDLVHSIIPGRNNALRLDLATNQNNDYFASPYHGSITHQPLGPENFRLTEPAYGTYIDDDFTSLKWELTQDPDLYDDVTYMLLVDRDSSQIAQLLNRALKNKKSLIQAEDQASLHIKQQVQQPHFLVEHLRYGDYFWAVVAYDRDHHVRYGKMNQRPIAKFHVTAPEPKVIAIQFEYSPWITQDDYQGQLKFTIRNTGDRTAENFSLSIYDSSITYMEKAASSIAERTSKLQKTLPILEPLEETTIELKWHTARHGLHQISTEIVNPAQNNKLVHAYKEDFYTIPKGTFFTDDTIVVQKITETIYDLPYIGKVFFDSNNSQVEEQYFQTWVIEPPLALFAKRLKENPSVNISLQGTIDPNSGENNVSLADDRAKAVRDTLHHLGVPLDQMDIIPGMQLPQRRMPAKAEDARWVLQERRRVEIQTEESSEKALFNPLQTIFVGKENVPVLFNTHVIGVVHIQQGLIYFGTNKQDSLVLDDNISGANIVADINWVPNSNDENTWDNWLKQDLQYSLFLTDSLNRQFRTRPQSTHLKSKIVGRERRYFVLARFESTDAFYQFYWSGLLDVIPYLLEDEKTRIRFFGHGCATGSEAINDRLSKKRANDFQNKFLADAAARYPDLIEEIKSRFDPPQGFGESRPFEIKTSTGKSILIGDDDTPLGRQLNRRVMVFIYTSR